ncbi:hypothetical protein D915_009508 [Fasciola hepatica]|uniref:Uncharacterized protein n=1 Tax=Fasciola hepatica TaxID=6192 RepID=A0A4E0QY30_FASHE|nr:hypothetical protein D915_009508 [Fasciola hepatica]
MEAETRPKAFRFHYVRCNQMRSLIAWYPGSVSSDKFSTLSKTEIIKPTHQKMYSMVLPVEYFAFLVNLLRSKRFRRKFSLFLISKQPVLFMCSEIRSVHQEAFSNIVSACLNKFILVEEAMSWFSTLGGGFSSLGENCISAAEIAGNISVVQLMLAVKIDSPIVQTKARLWYAQSLMQRGYLREAARMLRSIYLQWKPLMKSSTPSQQRIDWMVVGLWERLRHLWRLRCQERKAVRRCDNSNGTDKYRRYFGFPDLPSLLDKFGGNILSDKP